MAKSKFTFGLRIAASANVEALMHYDQQAGVDTSWSRLPQGSVFTGKELRRDYERDVPKSDNKAIFWFGVDESITRLARKWSSFKSITRTALYDRELEDAVRERNIARNVLVLRVAAVVGAVVYGAYTGDLKGAGGIASIGNQLADKLTDGNLSVADLGALVQATGEQLGVDVEAELREMLTEAGVSDADQDELLKPFLEDLDAAEDAGIDTNSTSLIAVAGFDDRIVPPGSKGGELPNLHDALRGRNESADQQQHTDESGLGDAWWPYASVAGLGVVGVAIALLL